ncbi:hypothetical protein ZIOFF_046914 [Zingiber officinale]|uniref:X8 domain-containing protein n=1 Tax=Zingiber officinale TaxID=94328 RepID=A0A8J5FLM8_ZINOF|nr:hypothetical protein ZIOFF_046914 [Zingiber officinale]
MAGKGPWCVAKPQITREALQANIDYVCGFAGWVCDKIQKGAPCYSTSIIRQASYAMNAYFFVFGPKGIDCDFNGTARIVHVDPMFATGNGMARLCGSFCGAYVSG